MSYQEMEITTSDYVDSTTGVVSNDSTMHKTLAYAWFLGQTLSIGSAVWLYLK